MAVRHNVKPNWGRSFPLSSLASGNQVELVRLDMQESRDVTLYLGDISAGNPCFPELYHITYANGGTSAEIDVLGSMVGSVMHVVASNVVVRGEKYGPLAATAIPNASPRITAMAALGRPYPSAVFASIGLGAGPATTLVISPLPAWTTRLQIQSWPAGANALVNLLYTDSGATKHYAVFHQPIEQYAEPQLISPLVTQVELVTAGTAITANFTMLRDN